MRGKTSGLAHGTHGSPQTTIEQNEYASKTKENESALKQKTDNAPSLRKAYWKKSQKPEPKSISRIPFSSHETLAVKSFGLKRETPQQGSNIWNIAGTRSIWQTTLASAKKTSSKP